MSAIAFAAATLLMSSSPLVDGRQWSDRTTLTFSESVRVPGATLPAGSYVFELTDRRPSTGVVTITDEAGSRVYAITHVIPTWRPAAPARTILLFLPLEEGSMPAVRGWYPPSGRYGYLLLYNDPEARELARRTRSVVLSSADPHGTMQADTIALTWPDGAITRWTQDVDTQREWEAWTRTRRESAARIGDAPRAEHVNVSELEDYPDIYLGKTVNVAGRVDEVYGPHLFELDEPVWDRLEGDVLVFLPEGSLAAVRENDQITVTGTLTQLSNTEVLGQASWIYGDAIMNQDIDHVMALVATRIAIGNHDRLIPMTKGRIARTPSAETALLTREATISYGDVDLVGRRIAFPFVMIESIDRGHGFFATAAGRSFFVMTAALETKELEVGDTVALDGIVLALPPALARELNVPSYTNTSIYVYASRLKSGS